MDTLSCNATCPECGQTYIYCEDCGGIVEPCDNECCYGPDGPSHLDDCVCDMSLTPNSK